MSSSSSYQSLFEEITKIASNYSLGTMISGFSPDLLNQLLRNNMDKVEASSSYEEAIKVLNEVAVSQIGFRVDVSNFIHSEDDRRKLYELFAQWRTQLLNDVSEILKESEKTAETQCHDCKLL
jgi:hypothetical protein